MSAYSQIPKANRNFFFKENNIALSVQDFSPLHCKNIMSIIQTKIINHVIIKDETKIQENNGRHRQIIRNLR